MGRPIPPLHAGRTKEGASDSSAARGESYGGGASDSLPCLGGRFREGASYRDVMDARERRTRISAREAEVERGPYLAF